MSAHILNDDPRTLLAKSFETWWSEQKGVLEMSPAVKFAAWNGYLAAKTSDRALIESGIRAALKAEGYTDPELTSDLVQPILDAVLKGEK